MLYIYLLSQSVRRGYYTYDSCVVCAESEEKARLINPSGGSLEHQSYDWVSACQVAEVKVALLGVAADGTVLCASFNAG